MSALNEVCHGAQSDKRSAKVYTNEEELIDGWMGGHVWDDVVHARQMS